MDWECWPEIYWTALTEATKSILRESSRQRSVQPLHGSFLNNDNAVTRLAEAVAAVHGITIIGGGDSIAAATKAGVNHAVRVAAAELAPKGIRVNALSPGPVNTPLLQELFAKDPERAARRLVHIPFGRFAEASEIAAATKMMKTSGDVNCVARIENQVTGSRCGRRFSPYSTRRLATSLDVNPLRIVRPYR